MQVLAFGFALLILVLVGGRWFATAQPTTVLRVLKWGGITVAALILFLVIRTGVLPLIFAAFAALLPWLFRAAHLHALYRNLRGSFGGVGGASWRQAGSRSPPDASQVETAWLRMSLDHETGSLEGEVLEGSYCGRRLGELSFEQVTALWHEVRADPQSLQLLEAWLDRAHPDWREQMAGGDERSTGESAAMTRDEALSVLGLEPGAEANEIKAAHRRLMMACHPDHGGSDWLAARINRAKDVLLAETAH